MHFQIRIREYMKCRLPLFFEDLSLNHGKVINMFFSQTFREVALPFRYRLSQFNREAEKAEASPVMHAGSIENMKSIIHHV